MTTGFSVTYERWNEQSIEAGDTDDRGYIVQGCSLTKAIRLGLEYRYPSWAGQCEPSDSRPGFARWLTFYRWNECTRENLETGIEEQRSLHIPEHITPASRRRIVRLFNS